jgi:hypothetical protein
VGEEGGGHHVVRPGGGRLVGGREHAEGLAHVHVQRRVAPLLRVRALRLHEEQLVALDPEAQRRAGPHVGHAQAVRAARTEREGGGVGAQAVDQDAVRGRQVAAPVQVLSPHPVWRHVVPPADEHVELAAVGAGERHGDDGAVVDADGAVAAGGGLEAQRRAVEEAAHLVLGLEHVGPVRPRRDRAVGARHAVVPRVPAHLQPVPVHGHATFQFITGYGGHRPAATHCQLVISCSRRVVCARPSERTHAPCEEERLVEVVDVVWW